MNLEAQHIYMLQTADHDKNFTVDVHIDGKKISSGTGHTKKAAEQQAAYQALLVLKDKE